jgi:HAMP domain-containing protein
MTLDLAILQYATQRLANHALYLSEGDPLDSIAEQLSEREAERVHATRKAIRRMLNEERNAR